MYALSFSGIHVCASCVCPRSAPNKLGISILSLKVKRKTYMPFKRQGLHWSEISTARRCSSGEWGQVEEEVLRFMESSSSPNRFPTKKELIDAGRADLVEAIISHGGWLAAGWDQVDSGVVEVDDNNVIDTSSNFNQVKNEDCPFDESPSLQNPIDISAVEVPEGSSSEKTEETGVKGILNRLERERSKLLTDASAAKWADRVESSVNNGGFWFDAKTPIASDGRKDSAAFLETLPQVRSEMMDSDIRNKIMSTRSWEMTDLMKTEDSSTERKQHVSDDISQSMTEGSHQSSSQTVHLIEDDPADNGKNELMLENSTYDNDARTIYCEDISDDVASRIQKLGVQLLLTMELLKSGDDTIDISNIFSFQSDTEWLDGESNLEDIQKASDALEFQETEIMKLRDKLRSTRARLSALEGRMTMELKDLRQVIVEKQKMLTDAQKILCVMKTARIVWPNSASEVLLAGSFDGWTGKRKMEKSDAGVFVLSLLLYPGRYEIKFIVDGIWRVDPQRPVVYNNGHENNLLIIK